MLWPVCFPGDSETLVERGDKQITITFIGKKYSTGESGTIILLYIWQIYTPVYGFPNRACSGPWGESDFRWRK